MTKYNEPPSPDPRAHATPNIADVPTGALAEPDLSTGPVSENRHSTATVLILAMGIVAYGAMETMVAPILPIIRQKLHATGPQISWVLTGLLLVGAVSVPLFSRLAEIKDKRKVMLFVLAAAGIGGATSALASNVAVLTVGQLLQGIGLASFPVAIGVMRDTLPPERLHRANGFLLSSSSTTAAAALLLVGPLTDHWSYTLVFWIPAAIIIAAIVLILAVVPPCPSQEHGHADWLGAIVLGGGLGAVLVGLTLSSSNSWVSWKVLGLIVLGLIAIAAFAVVELRVESPLLDIKMAAGRDVALVLGTSLSAGFGQFSMWVILPSLATLSVATGYGMGGGASTASTVIFTFVAIAALTALITSRISDIIGSRNVMILSGVLFTVSALLLLLIGSVHWIPFVASGLAGAALGGGQVQQLNILSDRVPTDRMTTITGMLWVLRSVGGTFGGQVVAAIIAGYLLAGSTISSWTGYVVAILACATAGVIVIVLALLLHPIAERSHAAEPAHA